MPKIRYGIIGSGMMGQEHIQNIALLDQAEVAAIYEPDDGMAQRSLELAPCATRVGSISELLGLKDLDCLLIASPNFCHVDQIEEIANTRPLPLLVEKPLFTDPSDGARLKQLIATYPAPIWIGMEYRYMPPITAFVKQAEETTGGIRMLTIREHRFPFLEKVNNWNRFNRNSGGTFVEKCCHFFDLMRHILKDEPIRIMASAGQAVNHLDESYDGEVPDILDHGYVIIDFAGGARAMLELCMFAEGSEYQEELSAVGPNGKIEALVPGPTRLWPDCKTHPEPILIKSPRAPKKPERSAVPVPADLLTAGDHNGATFYQHQAFLSLLNGERTDADVSIRDGWSAVVMGLAAQKSAATGESVDYAAFEASLTR